MKQKNENGISVHQIGSKLYYSFSLYLIAHNRMYKLSICFFFLLSLAFNTHNVMPKKWIIFFAMFFQWTAHSTTLVH